MLLPAVIREPIIMFTAIYRWQSAFHSILPLSVGINLFN